MKKGGSYEEDDEKEFVRGLFFVKQNSAPQQNLAKCWGMFYERKRPYGVSRHGGALSYLHMKTGDPAQAQLEQLGAVLSKRALSNYWIQHLRNVNPNAVCYKRRSCFVFITTWEAKGRKKSL